MATAARVAIVGSGPSGFYTAEALLRTLDACRISMFERLHAPHGLVRYGVAPDHQKLKQVGAVFDRIAEDPRFSFFGGVDVGRDLSVAELRARHDAVVLATGCPDDRRLGVPGEDLAQIHGSARFVGWYNGHPDACDLQPDLSGDTAVVIGHGNVALDVCRLLVRDYGELRRSDIPAAMQPAFAARGTNTVHLLGRSGIDATKFTFKEFRQLVELPGLRVVVPQLASLSAASWAPSADDDAARVADWLRANAGRDTSPSGPNAVFWFHVRPRAFEGRGRVEHVVLDAAPQGPAAADVPATLRCDLVVSCVGYRARGWTDMAPDPARGAWHHRAGQLLDGEGRVLPGLFVAGWAKRGPSGIIGTNRADGCETAETLCAQLPSLRRDGRSEDENDAITRLLKARGIEPLSYAQWRLLDICEKRDGAMMLKPREKLLTLKAARERLRDEEASAPWPQLAERG